MHTVQKASVELLKNKDELTTSDINRLEQLLFNSNAPNNRLLFIS